MAPNIKSIWSARSKGRISTLVMCSYVVDWIVLVLAAALGAAFSTITPNKRPFSLTNPEISFPHVVHEKISTGLAVVCSLIIPAVIILFVSLVLVPGPTVPKSVRRSLIWRRKLWEWHTGWLGLALSCALAFVTTNGMKNLFGKPRPDLLARCDPDIENVTKWVIGGGLPSLGQSFLVSAGICRQTDLSMLNDGFRSYPSGHSSFSAAGLVYLSLFLASKLALTVPSITLRSYGNDTNRLNSAFPSRSRMSQPQSYRTTDTQGGDNNAAAGTSQSGHDRATVAARNQAAAPPLYLLLVAIIPFLASVYISSTRYSDFRHHGFDILFGWLMGTICAIFSFRMYHLPIGRGAGWSWGPRSRDRSFWAGVGVGSYVSEVDVATTDDDVERGVEHADVSRLLGAPQQQSASSIGTSAQARS